MAFLPQKDKAEFNLLPNSLVHQNRNEAIKFFHITAHKYQYTSTESHSFQKEINSIHWICSSWNIFMHYKLTIINL